MNINVKLCLVVLPKFGEVFQIQMALVTVYLLRFLVELPFVKAHTFGRVIGTD